MKVYCKGGIIPPSESEEDWKVVEAGECIVPMKDIKETVKTFVQDLQTTERFGGGLYVPNCIRDWKKLDDDSYIVMVDEKEPMMNLKAAWDKLNEEMSKSLDAIVETLHLNDIIDWILAKLGKGE